MVLVEDSSSASRLFKPKSLSEIARLDLNLNLQSLYEESDSDESTFAVTRQTRLGTLARDSNSKELPQVKQM